MSEDYSATTEVPVYFFPLATWTYSHRNGNLKRKKRECDICAIITRGRSFYIVGFDDPEEGDVEYTICETCMVLFMGLSELEAEQQIHVESGEIRFVTKKPLGILDPLNYGKKQ